jgi:hypothetical protein
MVEDLGKRGLIAWEAVSSQPKEAKTVRKNERSKWVDDKI